MLTTQLRAEILGSVEKRVEDICERQALRKHLPVSFLFGPVYAKGMASASQGRHNEALEFLHEAIKKATSRRQLTEASLAAGDIYRRCGDLSSERLILDSLTPLNIRSPQFTRRSGWNYLGQAKYLSGWAEFERLRPIHPFMKVQQKLIINKGGRFSSHRSGNSDIGSIDPSGSARLIDVWRRDGVVLLGEGSARTQLFFSRFIALLHKRGVRNVKVITLPSLERVFLRLNCKVLSLKDLSFAQFCNYPSFDAVARLSSLPYLLRIDEIVPSTRLLSDDDLKQRFDRMSSHSGFQVFCNSHCKIATQVSLPVMDNNERELTLNSKCPRESEIHWLERRPQEKTNAFKNDFLDVAYCQARADVVIARHSAEALMASYLEKETIVLLDYMEEPIWWSIPNIRMWFPTVSVVVRQPHQSWLEALRLIRDRLPNRLGCVHAF